MSRLESVAYRIADLHEQIATFEYVCSGTLMRRRLACGKANCCCKKDPALRHGPYYGWTRRYQGRLICQWLSKDQARIIERAIKNYRRVLKILRLWEKETVRAIEAKPNQS